MGVGGGYSPSCPYFPHLISPPHLPPSQVSCCWCSAPPPASKHLPSPNISLPGVLLLVFCRSELAQHVGEVSTASVACGVMGVGGNKGAVRGQGGAEGPAHTPAKPYFIALYAAALYTETIHLVIY